MNFWMDNALEELMKVIRRVDIIIINDEEALQLSGKDTIICRGKRNSVFWP
jgi:sugar/nucleoside kinase (ribokinase family)